MNRTLMAGAGAALAASVAAGGLLMAGPASASAAHQAAPPAALAACSAAHHNHPFPGGPTTYRAGTAGTVTVAPVNHQTIRVAGVHAAPGYRAFVDSRRGSSVDVYFRSHARRVKFEAEINDAGGLTITVTTCR